MARHSAKKSSTAQRALMRAGLTLTAAGAALGGGAVSAGAAEPAAVPLASPVGDLDAAAAGERWRGRSGPLRTGVSPRSST